MTEHDLLSLFSAYGSVADISVIVDRGDDPPRILACVTMTTPASARRAIRALRNQPIGFQILAPGETSWHTWHAGPMSRSGIPHRSVSQLY